MRWVVILADAPATLNDLSAAVRYRFNAERQGSIAMPVLLQTGSESPRDLYLTDSLAQTLPLAQIGLLDGQAQEGMTAAPVQYADSVTSFLSEQ